MFIENWKEELWLFIIEKRVYFLHVHLHISNIIQEKTIDFLESWFCIYHVNIEIASWHVNGAQIGEVNYQQ